MTVDQADAYSIPLATSITQILDKAGVKVSRESQPATQTDFTSLANKAVAQKAKVVVFASQTASNAQLFLQQLKSKGYTGAFLGTDGGFADTLFTEPGAYMSSFSLNINDIPVARPYVAEFTKKYGDTINSGVPSYIAVQMIAMGISNACSDGKVSRSEVRREISKVGIKTSLLGAPKDPEAEVRFEAVSAVSALAAYPHGLITYLAPLLADKSAKVSTRAAVSLLRCDPQYDQAKKYLRQIAILGDLHERTQAIAALGDWGDVEEFNFLANELQDRTLTPAIRRNILVSMRRIDAAKSIPYLIHSLGRENRLILESSAELCWDRSVPPLLSRSFIHCRTRKTLKAHCWSLEILPPRSFKRWVSKSPMNCSMQPRCINADFIDCAWHLCHRRSPFRGGALLCPLQVTRRPR